MKNQTRKILSAGGALLLLTALTGCSAEPVITEQKRQIEITFSWWGNDGRNEYTIEAIRQFEEMHPEIKVNCSYSEWTGFEARSRVQMISDTEADVMQINFDWLTNYSPDGTGYYDLESLSELVDLSNYTDEMLEYGRSNGVLNALPIAMNVETLYFNKTIFDSYNLEIPETWDDLFDAAKVLKKDGIYPLAGAQKSIWLFILAYAEQMSGKTLLNDDGTLQFKAEEFQIMLEMYRDMVNEGVIPQVEYFVRTEIDKQTYAGAVAWISDAVNYFSERINQGDEIITANYTNIDPEHSGEGWYAKPATLYTISKNTDHPREAGMLLNYLVSSQEMALLQGVEKGIPLNQAAQNYIEEEGLLTGIQYEASQRMERTEGFLSMKPYLENVDMIDTFIDACNQVLFDKVTSEEAANELYKFARDATKK